MEVFITLTVYYGGMDVTFSLLFYLVATRYIIFRERDIILGPQDIILWERFIKLNPQNIILLERDIIL